MAQDVRLDARRRQATARALLGEALGVRALTHTCGGDAGLSDDLRMTLADGEATPEGTALAQPPEDAIVAHAVVARTVNEAIADGRRDESATANFICECGVLGHRAAC